MYKPECTQYIRDKIVENFSPIEKRIVDGTIYKSNMQQFRLPYNQKFGSNRPKIPVMQ